MSARAAQCPNCGAEVLFAAGSSLVTVCKQCRAAVARKGVNVEAIGVVAELVPTSSPFRVGMASRGSKTFRPFRIIGRLQLSTGEGTWDEWHVAFGDGGYAWLAEAQGGFWMMLPIKAPRVPEWESLSPGMPLPLGGYGTFTVTEVREATYQSAEGDLPFVAPPGSLFRYADLSGADGSLGTLDYGDDPGIDAFFVGRKVEIAELGIEGLAAWKERKEAARAQALNCPSCGGALQLKDPAATVRIACTYCGSLLGSKEGGDAPPSKFEVLKKLQSPPFKPLLPIGSAGTLDGHPFVILGAVQKAVSSGGEKFTWREYLLKETKSEAYHWLAESDGHWTLLAPVPAGEVNETARLSEYGGSRYRIFSRGSAKVDAVLGEFYWTIKKGETTEATDFVAPPRMLSKEKAEKEIAWTEGRYVQKDEIEAAFALKEKLPAPTGVGACQPWPHAGTAKVWWRTAKVLALAAIAFYAVSFVRAPRKVVFDKTYQLYDAAKALYVEAGTAPPKETWQVQAGPAKSIAERRATDAEAAAKSVLLSEPFTTERQTNLRVQFSAPSSNNWVGVGADLISETTGEVRSFYLLSDRYSGVDGGESWSEGSQGRSVWLSQLPAGRYVLRLDPESDVSSPPASFRVKLTSGVPRLLYLVWTLVLLLLGPLYLGLSKVSFEGRRWSGSDFSQAGVERTDDGGDGDGGDS